MTARLAAAATAAVRTASERIGSKVSTGGGERVGEIDLGSPPRSL